MKIKLVSFILSCLILSLVGCDDSTGSIGLDMFPGSDLIINGQTKTFDVKTRSERMDRTFAKTSVGYLGKFTDPDFGYYEAGFLAQLRCNEGMTFPEKYDSLNPAHKTDFNAIIVGEEGKEIFRTELVLTYAKYFGDDRTASHLSVHRLNKNLETETAYYTDINPEAYYDSNDPKSLIGEKAYTAVDYSLSDSIRNLSKYTPYLNITIANEVGQEIYNKAKENKGKDFAPIFKDLFKGVYVKNNYGDGSILYVDQVELRVIYQCVARNDTTGVVLKKYKSNIDSTYYGYRTFAATKEIVQANTFNSDEDKIQEKLNETDCTYLKTPAGLYTQATLPLQKIHEELHNDTLNVAQLSFINYNKSLVTPYPMAAPEFVLLVREKDREEFFIKNKISDEITSFIARHNVIKANRYIFPNITQLINTCIAEREQAIKTLKEKGSINEVKDANGLSVTTIEAWEEATKWDKIAIIPVAVKIDESNQSQPMILSILNDLKQGCVKLIGGENSPVELKVTYTSFD